MKEHERGMAETNAANVPGGHRLAAQAAADFAADNPEVDLDKAARDLKKSGFMERGPQVGDTVVGDLGEGQKTYTIADGPAPSGIALEEQFEATPEELAAQAPRRAIQDATAGATSGEGEVV